MNGSRTFPEGFLWGAATSAHQVEGNNHNDWSEWETSDPKHFISGTACDHYNRFREDFDIAKSLGHNAHRFSLEWSRIEPEEGKFNQEAIEHYRQVLMAQRERGLEPFVTIWHWTNPVWIRDMGGWENEKTIRYFVRFVEKVSQEYKDLVQFWMPLNEPETYIGLSYVAGRFPPQKKSLLAANQVFKHLVQAHRQAYTAIKKISPQAQVGASHYALYIDAYQNRLQNRMLASFLHHIRNKRFWNAFHGYRDFFGLQYYHHNRVALTLRGTWKPDVQVDVRFPSVIQVRNENKETTDNGWEIYPEGIYHLLKEIAPYHEPVYITENGIADAADAKREKFIRDHLAQVHRALQEGVDVRGYFYWSLLDNFEWDNGYAARFGLVEVDYRTQERKVRPSAYAYKNIIESNSLE